LAPRIFNAAAKKTVLNIRDKIHDSFDYYSWFWNGERPGAPPLDFAMTQASIDSGIAELQDRVCDRMVSVQFPDLEENEPASQTPAKKSWRLPVNGIVDSGG